jgi:peptidoglycan/xylan/chitin deacetylase (PgdA/CDA1 family)
MVHFVLFVLHYLGLNQLFYAITRKRQKIITYHNVINDKYFDDTLHLGVSHSQSVFKFQLKEIAKTSLNFSTEINQENSVMITFDDGYQNKFVCARPILNDLNIGAVFFITSDLINSKYPLWVDKILLWFSYVPKGNYVIDEISYFISDSNRHTNYSKFYKHVLANYIELDNLLVKLDLAFSFDKISMDKTYYKLRFEGLSKEQITALKADGHLVACHSKKHSVLSKLSEDQLNQELEYCQLNLSLIYNSTYFSYPFGGHDEVDEKVVNKLENSAFTYSFMNIWNYKFTKSDSKIERFSLPNTKRKYIIHSHLSGLYYFLKSFK